MQRSEKGWSYVWALRESLHEVVHHAFNHPIASVCVWWKHSIAHQIKILTSKHDVPGFSVKKGGELIAFFTLCISEFDSNYDAVVWVWYNEACRDECICSYLHAWAQTQSKQLHFKIQTCGAISGVGWEKKWDNSSLIVNESASRIIFTFIRKFCEIRFQVSVSYVMAFWNNGISGK